MTLLYYYKLLYRPGAGDGAAPPVGKKSRKKARKRKKVYEVIGPTLTAIAQDSLTEEVAKWREIKANADKELREIKGGLDLLAAKEAVKALKIRLALEAEKLYENARKRPRKLKNNQLIVDLIQMLLLAEEAREIRTTSSNKAQVLFNKESLSNAGKEKIEDLGELILLMELAYDA